MTGRPSRRRKEARPAELLDAALDVFAEKGFAAARMEDIAARAGTAKGTIYLYFPSKEAVFQALVRAAIIPNLERAEEAAERHEGPVGPLVIRFMALLADLLRETRLAVLPRLIIAEIHRFPDLTLFYKTNVVDRGMALIARMHRRGVERGEFRPQDSETVARLVVAPVLLMAIWSTVFAPHEPHPFDPGTVLAAHAETLLRGLAADPVPDPAGMP